MFLSSIPWYYAPLSLGILCWIQILIRRASSSRAINKRGARAPAVPTWWPLGLDLTAKGVMSLLNCEAHIFWDWMFEVAGAKAKNSYTAEFTIFGNIRIVFTADPENMKAILTSQFSDYGKGENFHKEWEAFLGDAILNVDGKQWHDGRAMIRPIFTRDRVGDLPVIETHVRKLISLLGPGDGRLVRLDEFISKYTLDAATHFLFGESARSMDQEFSEFQVAFDAIQSHQGLVVRAGPLKLFMSEKKFKNSLRIADEFIQPYIRQALSLSPAELETKLAKSDTFIDSLARYTRDPKLMRDQLISILLAGRDTTASTLSWAFLELARNPHVVQKIRAEISDTIGDSGRAPTYQEVKDMKYVTYVINETLRLYPAVPYNTREALTDTTLPHGAGPDGLSPVGVEKGTAIAYSTLIMQRRRDLYPEISESFPYDPADWVPDRWYTWVPKSWQYIPFNGGPRICIGQQFAMVEMGYTIVRILQEFESLIDYGNTVKLKAEIVLTPGDGVKIGFCSPRGKPS